jgi:hypothetical protein
VYGRQPAILIELQEKSRQEFKYLLNSMFANADQALFEIAGHAPTNAQQNLYFESMRTLRMQRLQFESRFGAEIAKDFKQLLAGCKEDNKPKEEVSLDDLTLVPEEELSENLALDSMITSVLDQHTQLLADLTRHIAGQLPDKKLSIKENPLGPFKLCKAFASICAGLEVDIHTRQIFYKLFAKYVVANLDNVYRIGNQLFLEHNKPGEDADSAALPDSVSGLVDVGDIIPEENKAPGEQVLEYMEEFNKQSQTPAILEGFSERREANQTIADKELGEDALLKPSGDAPAMSSQKVIDLLTEIQHQQAGQPLPQEEDGEVGHFNVYQLIDDALRQRGESEPQSVPMLEEQSIDLVALLFKAILEDAQLSRDIKVPLLQLQVPLVKVALIDYKFYDKPSHPARRLLNEIALNMVGWTAEIALEEDKEYQQLIASIRRIQEEFAEDVFIFEEVLSDYQVLVEEEQKVVQLVERRTIQAEGGKAKVEEARQVVQRVMSEKIADVTLPACVVELLSKVWSDVLFLILVKEGQGGSNWQHAVKTVDHLIWSIQPLKDSQSKTKLRKVIPLLVSNLRGGLRRVNFDGEKADRFFAELETLHQNNLNRAVDEIAENRDTPRLSLVEKPARPLSGAEENEAITSLPWQAPDDDISFEGIDSELLKEPPGEGSEEHDSFDTDQTEVTADREVCEHQVDALTVGAWLEIIDEDGKQLRCRLAAKIESADRFIFVNRSGVKVAERSRDQLVNELADGELLVLENSQLFDRALQSVIGNLRELKSQPAS